jgi:nucleoside-diphosphate-sugar epimerase
MTEARTVLILGAGGRFGFAVAGAFARAGWRVLGQVRPGRKVPVCRDVEWLACDLNDHAGLLAAAAGASVVVHALNPPYLVSAWRTQAPVVMTLALRLAQDLGATLMFPGNVYNFGEAMPAVLHEDTPQASELELGRIRIGLERQMIEAVKQSRTGLTGVVVRAGNFFGSGSGTFLDQLGAAHLVQGRSTWIGPREVSTPWAYLPDLARSFVMLAQQRQGLKPFEVFHFEGHQLTTAQWLDALTDVAWEQGWLAPQGRLKVRLLPRWMLALAGLFTPTLRTVAQTSYLFRTPHRLDGQKLRNHLGEEPRTPFDVALRRSLRDMGLPMSASSPGLAPEDYPLQTSVVTPLRA